MAGSIAVRRVRGFGFSCTFACGELGSDDAVRASGHEPNGYFWEALLRHLAPDVAGAVELDSEADMFSATGRRRHLERVRAVLEPHLHDGERVTAAIRAAEAQGLRFDD